jgi:hypothetical protein
MAVWSARSAPSCTRTPARWPNKRLARSRIAWLEAQFRLLGKGKESRDLAAHLLSAVEGAALRALTFHDSRHVVRESAHLKRWLRTL